MIIRLFTAAKFVKSTEFKTPSQDSKYLVRGKIYSVSAVFNHISPNVL